ncbi:thioredoxin family protein [uncultured Sphingomonas sp.]|uniref:protein-disulfide reductase DsbD family protein n=1 Tax=uncultured Sphingomonas sp. TaxID=158754 RepID=UPI0025D7A2FE|nr:thioredoxin family protein [uncultured Sphingomonas sp.]
MMRWLLILLALAGITTTRAAAPTHITPALVAETTVPRAGSRVTLAIAMRPDPTWHGYWRNPGDAGLEARIAWTALAGLRFGRLVYPVPETLLLAGLMNYVYAHDYALLVPLDVPAGLKPGMVLPVSAKFDWLACNPQMCVPETATLALRLTVGDGTVTPDRRAQFDRWRAALPRPLGSKATFQISGKRFRLEVPLPAGAAASQPYFFPLTDGVIDYAARQVATRSGNRLVIQTAAREGSAAKTVQGVLRLDPGRGLSLSATAGTVAAVAPLPGRQDGATGQSGGSGFLLAFGGALLGGLLLNIMPCVFPILSLKALSLARSGESEGTARAEALAYTGGVVLVCAGLGAALLGLRAAGGLAGWAFQLQDTRVIGLLMLLVLAIGLNLAGLFELPTFAGGDRLVRSGGAAGAFWTGALAAFVATPCTGPFMGAALGAALVLPAPAAVAVFVGLGVGLALPFLLLGFVPALRRLLPRPGAWMDRLRRILAVPMLVTALGLSWILGRQNGVDGMTAGLAAALILGLGFWWAGRRQMRLAGGAWLPALVGGVAAAALATNVPRAPAEAAPQQAGTERFDEVRLAALRATGRPVFLYFTADWCLTCKVNEKAAIERGPVTQAFAARKVAVMVGDWTRGDPAISRFLEAHGRSGVPLYLYYPPGGGEPRELPQVLTPTMLTQLV